MASRCSSVKFVSPQKHVGRATATYFVLLHVGVGIAPYTLGLLVAAPRVLCRPLRRRRRRLDRHRDLLWAAIGRTGIFSQWAMKPVRALRLNEIEIDPAAVSRAKREG